VDAWLSNPFPYNLCPLFDIHRHKFYPTLLGLTAFLKFLVLITLVECGKRHLVTGQGKSLVAEDLKYELICGYCTVSLWASYDTADQEMGLELKALEHVLYISMR
jgi:hypothetical protein